MLNLKLTGEDAMILHNLASPFIENLRVEIMHTDRRECRDMLTRQETS